MARAWLLGIVALAFASACGQTERNRPQSMGVGGAHAGAAAGGAGSGQLAGTAGTAGGMSPELSAVAECEGYCETLSYRLPGALCEDWNRDAWGRPEFCVGGYAMSCAEYCVNVYETVSPECAEVLPPAIRCVAPTYASLSPPLVDDCWLRDCRDQLYTMTSACYGLRDQLAAARAIWEASGVVEYQLQYDWGSGMKAQVLVRPGSEPAVMPADAVAWTVPKLFDEVERYLDTPNATPSVTYDEDLGYVVQLIRLQGCEASDEGVLGIEVGPPP